LASARTEFYFEKGPALFRPDESGGRVPATVRLLILLVAIMLAGLFSHPGRAADAPVVDDPTVSGDVGGATSSEDTLGSSPTEGSEPVPGDLVEPVPGDTVEPPPGDTVEPAPTPETPPSDTVEPPPAETPPTEVVEPPPTETPPIDVVEPPPAETPPIDVVEPPPAETPPIDVVEPPPAESPPVPPSLPEEPVNPSLEDGGTAMPVLGLASSGIPTLFDAAGSGVLSAGGSDQASASGGTPRGDPSSPQSKAEDPLLRVPAPQPSTASASPSAAGVAPPSGGAGFGIAAEFVGPLLAMLSCALALFLTLPHGAVCALRSERPG
jgi:hypothetical protein